MIWIIIKNIRVSALPHWLPCGLSKDPQLPFLSLISWLKSRWFVAAFMVLWPILSISIWYDLSVCGLEIYQTISHEFCFHKTGMRCDLAKIKVGMAYFF